MKELSIIIPVYNSFECVKELSNQIQDALKNIEYEQIMINDCSKDSSWEEIQKICAENKNVIGINLRKNSGQDSAILTGLNYAKGKYIVIMDDDLQQKFVDTCINAKCKLLISGYDNEIYKQLEDAGFQKIGFEVSVYGGNNISRTKTEYLWKNYDQQEISETSENISELF